MVTEAEIQNTIHKFKGKTKTKINTIHFYEPFSIKLQGVNSHAYNSSTEEIENQKSRPAWTTKDPFSKSSKINLIHVNLSNKC